jgi:hypothetical protein
MAENRLETRANVFLAAVLEDDTSSRPVRVRNLSAWGALVEGQFLPPVGTSIRLIRGQLRAVGSLAWVNAALGGINFHRRIEAQAWLKGAGHREQQRVDEVVKALRNSEVITPHLLDSSDAPSVANISTSLDQVCERLGAFPNMSVEFGEELLRLDAIAQQLRAIAR